MAQVSSLGYALKRDFRHRSSSPGRLISVLLVLNTLLSAFFLPMACVASFCRTCVFCSLRVVSLFGPEGLLISCALSSKASLVGAWAIALLSKASLVGAWATGSCPRHLRPELGQFFSLCLCSPRHLPWELGLLCRCPRHLPRELGRRVLVQGVSDWSLGRGVGGWGEKVFQRIRVPCLRRDNEFYGCRSWQLSQLNSRCSPVSMSYPQAVRGLRRGLCVESGRHRQVFVNLVETALVTCPRN